VLERIAQRRAQLQRKALKQAKAIYEKKRGSLPKT